MFKLKSPCSNCPFKKGLGSNFRLSSHRLSEIETAMAFQCHKTVEYKDDDTTSPGDKPNQCAGLMAVLHREEVPNKIMELATKWGHLNPDELDPRNEAYDNWDQVMLAHLYGEEPE